MPWKQPAGGTVSDRETSRQVPFSRQGCSQEGNNCAPKSFSGAGLPITSTQRSLRKRRPQQGVLYLVASDTTLTADASQTLYRTRWHVEEYHKSLKTECILGKISYTHCCNTNNSLLCGVVRLCQTRKCWNAQQLEVIQLSNFQSICMLLWLPLKNYVRSNRFILYLNHFMRNISYLVFSNLQYSTPQLSCSPLGNRRKKF